MRQIKGLIGPLIFRGELALPPGSLSLHPLQMNRCMECLNSFELVDIDAGLGCVFVTFARDSLHSGLLIVIIIILSDNPTDI